ncbi:MAG: hypothetical protein Tsb002_30920 [Wenzhouxiangellaceae bacterium]
MAKFYFKRTLPAIIGGVLTGLMCNPADAILVTRNISGIWDLPEAERHGMTITVTQLNNGEKSVVAYLATYDQNGQPTWYATQGSVDGEMISGPLFVVTGPGFLAPRGTPSNFEQVGTMDITFSDCDNGLVSFQTPEDVIGTGGFRIQRISNLFREDCTGGIVDDVPQTASVTNFDIALTSTGLDSDASGDAEFEERPNRTEFKVEVEDLDVGVYELFVDGVKRADIDVTTDNNGTQGEVEFRSPVEPGKILLDFDPRGALLEVSQGGDVYLTSDLPDQGTPPPPPPGSGNPPPFGNLEIDVDLVNLGVFPLADGDAELELRSDRVDFDVEIEDVPVGDYVLLVGGVERATITVVEVPGGTEGEVEFRFPAEPGKILLDFDPRGEMVVIQDAGTDILAVDFPLDGGTGGDDDDDDDDDDNGGSGGDDDDDDDDDDNGGSGGGDDDDDDGDDDNGGSGGDDDTTDVEVTVAFNNVGPDSDASGRVEYEDRGDRTDFKVEAEDLDDGMYELLVGGNSVAMMMVSGGEGELEFRDPVEPGKLPLDFDPLGQIISIEQGGTEYLSVLLPNL